MSDTEVYRSTKDLTSNEVAEAIRKLNWEEPERYRIEWESETRHHPSTRYIVNKISFEEGGKPTLEIIGGRGGRYVIDSNPAGKPQLRYLSPEGNESEERLIEFTIFDTEFDWRHWIRQKMGNP